MISFCIITDGMEPEKLDAQIESIRALGCKSEIIVSGNPHVGADADLIVAMPHTAKQGRLGALRNGAVGSASGEIIIVTDDDMTFFPQWDRMIEEFPGEWDVMSCVILNPDGSRYWDWKAHENGMNWLLPYDSTDPRQSLTGGLTIMKDYVAKAVHWDDDRGFNQSEDVDFTNRLKKAGFRIVMNPAAAIRHNGNYSQSGIAVIKL